jgi:hypothetical protein
MLKTLIDLENSFYNSTLTPDQYEEQLHKYLVENHFVQTAQYPKNDSGQSLRPYYNRQIRAFVQHVLEYGFKGCKFAEGDKFLLRWGSKNCYPKLIQKFKDTGAEDNLLEKFKSNIEMLSYIEGYNQATNDVGKLCWCRNS